MPEAVVFWLIRQSLLALLMGALVLLFERSVRERPRLLHLDLESGVAAVHMAGRLGAMARG